MADWRRVAPRALVLLGPVLATACANEPGPGATQLRGTALPGCTRPQPIIDRNYILFFDRHSAQLTARNKTILQEFARHMLRERAYRVDVLGHIDASETAGGDRGLGAKRAAAARDFLIQAGLSPEILKTRDFGATRLRVQTDPGVPEPQNRYLNFYYGLQGSPDRVADRAACREWLLKSFCAPLADARDGEACSNAVKSL